jgi:hypothetical protein
MKLFCQTSYCDIYLNEDNFLEPFRMEYTTVGSNSNTATDREKIAYYISSTPDVYQLDKYKIPITEDILYQLADCRNYAVRIAKCFFFDKVNKPLERDLEEGLIDEFERDLSLLNGEFYENIWKIISNKWKKIKPLMAKTFDDFSFNSELQLMERIIDEHLTEPFINFTTAGYKEYSPHRHKTMWKLRLKSTKEELTDKEQKKLKQITKERANTKGEINKWTGRFLGACMILAEKDTYIAAHLSIYTELVKAKDAYHLKMHCNPLLSSHRAPSHSWANGRIKPLNNS